MPALLSSLFPPLSTYCPILGSVSAPQATFLLVDSTEAMYGGAVGGGKTGALLMAALQYVDVPGYSALIMRRTFPELEQPDGPIPQSLRWFAETPESIRPRYNQADHEWRFPSGAVLKFGHLDHPNAMIRYQGGAYHFFGFDELTHFDEKAYEFIGFSRTRRPPTGPLSQVPMRVRATANPGGPGHGWVKRRFLDERAPDVVFVPAKLKDNPGIDYDDYVSRLGQLDETLRQQLLEGDWGAFADAAYKVGDVHKVRGFHLRDSFARFEAADYGLNGAPWGLWAVDYDGNLICVDLIYEKGLLASELCPLVVAKRKAGWGFQHKAWMDPSVWHRTGTRNRWGKPAMLVDEFFDNGVAVDPADNDPRAGLARIRELLKPDPGHRFPAWHPWAGRTGSPRIFFCMPVCDALIKELESAPLQPIDKTDGGEKVDPDWESQHGHAAAMVRYAALSKPDPSVRPDPLAGIPGPLRNYEIDAAAERAAFLNRKRREADQGRPQVRRTERV